ncbi:MAG TPA: sigma-70 family RNA polymerase sigma factor [Puia sp.]|nr:sigma-70 family RNA polymerase sigma factor [Puia sp.]
MEDFHRLLLSNTEYLKKFAIQFTRNPEDAKDLLNETMCKALMNRDKYSTDTNMQAWAFIIMRNIFINNYRHKMRGRRIFSNDMFGRQKEAVVERKGDTAESLLNAKDILAAIHVLPRSLRVSLKLVIEGYPYKEISDILGVPLGTVKSRIHLARKSLQKAIRA